MSAAQPPKKPEEEQRKEEQRLERSEKIIDEIISTETTYNDQLKNLIKNLITPLKNDKKYVKDDSIVKRLERIESLVGISDKMLKELKDIKNVKDRQSDVANVFDKYGPFMKLYGQYINIYSEILEINARLSISDKKYVEVLNSFKENSASKGLDAMSHFILPIQRIPRYLLLLRELNKYAAPENSEKLAKTVGVLETVAADINEQKKQAEKKEAIEGYYKKLQSSNKKEARVAKRIVFSPRETLRKDQASFRLSTIAEKSDALVENLNSDLANINSNLTKLNKDNVGENVDNFRSVKASNAIQVVAKMTDGTEYTFLLKRDKSGGFKITIKEDISKLPPKKIENLFKIAQKIGEEVCVALEIEKGTYKTISVDPFQSEREAQSRAAPPSSTVISAPVSPTSVSSSPPTTTSVSSQTVSSQTSSTAPPIQSISTGSSGIDVSMQLKLSEIRTLKGINCSDNEVELMRYDQNIRKILSNYDRQKNEPELIKAVNEFRRARSTLTSAAQVSSTISTQPSLASPSGPVTPSPISQVSVSPPTTEPPDSPTEQTGNLFRTTSARQLQEKRNSIFVPSTTSPSSTVIPSPLSRAPVARSATTPILAKSPESSLPAKEAPTVSPKKESQTSDSSQKPTSPPPTSVKIPATSPSVPRTFVSPPPTAPQVSLTEQTGNIFRTTSARRLQERRNAISVPPTTSPSSTVISAPVSPTSVSSSPPTTTSVSSQTVSSQTSSTAVQSLSTGSSKVDVSMPLKLSEIRTLKGINCSGNEVELMRYDQNIRKILSNYDRQKNEPELIKAVNEFRRARSTLTSGAQVSSNISTQSSLATPGHAQVPSAKPLVKNHSSPLMFSNPNPIQVSTQTTLSSLHKQIIQKIVHEKKSYQYKEQHGGFSIAGPNPLAIVAEAQMKDLPPISYTLTCKSPEDAIRLLQENNRRSAPRSKVEISNLNINGKRYTMEAFQKEFGEKMSTLSSPPDKPATNPPPLPPKKMG